MFIKGLISIIIRILLKEKNLFQDGTGFKLHELITYYLTISFTVLITSSPIIFTK